MNKLEPLMPENPHKLWKSKSTYEVIEMMWTSINETREQVNNAMDAIESDILSNDYAAVKALSSVQQITSKIESLNELITKAESKLANIESRINNLQG